MHIPVFLIGVACLLHAVVGDETPEDADALAEANAAKGSQLGSHVGEVDVHNGDEGEEQPGSFNTHGNAMEVVMQELQAEVEDEGVLLKGNIADEIEQVAEQQLNNSQVPPSIRHTPLEVEHDAEEGGESLQRQANGVESRWPKGVIPYSFTVIKSGERAESASGQEAIVRAMRFYEATTCLTFPKMSATVHADNGLKHTSYLRFVVKGGCWSYVGRIGRSGQGIACCSSFGVCLHEIGHAIGYLHEQDRSDRELYVQLHPENAQLAYAWVFNRAPHRGGLNVHPYDLGSMMHYGSYGFSRNGLMTVRVKDKSQAFLLGNSEASMSHYDVMGTNKYYECAERCTDKQKALQCQNDGFLDDHCKCKCSKLFTGDKCQDLYKPTADISWPQGSYGLPGSIAGCPREGFTAGSRAHATAGASRQQDGGKMPPIDRNLLVDNFCMRSDSTSGSADWPAGTYCIYQQGNTCPTGFESGWIFMDDQNSRSNVNSVKGSLPKGDFNKDTKYFYCCRSDGSAQFPIVLPRATPFHLFRSGGTCQTVKGMLNTAYYIRVDQEDSAKGVSSQSPSPSFNSWRRDVFLYYCYYSPLNYDDCGGIFDLTDKAPSVNIQSPNYPANYDNSRLCTWYIKAPTGKHLALDFDDFDIEDTSYGTCVDTVEVRHTLIAQPGHRYCGKGFKRTLISTGGFAIISLLTDPTGTRKGFNATARILSDDEQCISIEDKGQTYRGAVSYTQQYSKCLPWEQTKHCGVNPLTKSYMHSGLVGHNNCRNPTSLLRPWCYITTYCKYDFCDVCGIAKCYDYFDDCKELTGKDPNYCNKTQAFHGCHKTCNFCGENIKKPVSSCARPVVQDKNAAIEPAKAAQKTFQFGEKVKLVCAKQIDGTPVTSELTCLTDGNYGGLQVFCGIVCPDGWTRYKDNCYKLFEEKAFYKPAIEACRAENAHVTSVKNANENAFIKAFTKGRSVYIGYNNVERTTWHWEDGFRGNYSNWKPGQPGGGHHDRCSITNNGLWDDVYCETYYAQMFVCKKKFTGFDSDYYCKDEHPTCQKIIGRNYQLCQENKDFAFAYCRRSCGVCPLSECPSPGVVDNAVLLTPDDYIQPGSYFEYNCSAGYELLSGNLGRTCLRDGALSGAPPVCRPEAEFEDKYGQKVFARDRTEHKNKLSVYDSAESNIQRDGKVLSWEVYSTKHTMIMAQVWRRSGDKFLLVGQSMLNLRPKRVTTYRLKTFERFMVQEGDLIGWFTPPAPRGLTYSSCHDNFAKRHLYQVHFDNLGNVQVGMNRTIPLIAKCRTYSIAVTIGGGAVGAYVNVAARSRDATCTASSGEELCSLAIDGGLAPFNNAWMSDNEGIGAFITITFSGSQRLVGARFMQRLSVTGQIQMITMTFSDGSSQRAGLSKRRGASTTDLTAARWDAFDLTPVMSSSVKVVVDSVYSTDYNGFIEIEFYADCAEGWVHFSGSCYKYGQSATKKWPDAQALCKSESAKLLHVKSAEENDFITKMIKGNTWLGTNDRNTEGSWIWSDGVTSAYSNWVNGKPAGSPLYLDCGFTDTAGTWRATYCGWKQQYVCEKPLDKGPSGPPITVVGSLVQPRRYLLPDKRLIIANRKETRFTKAETVVAWKIYGRENSTLVLAVWRPVAGSTNSFTLVGSNSAQTKAGWVTFVHVPVLWQIKVQPGDLIGLQFPAGQVGLVYDTCNHNKVQMTRFERTHGWGGSLEPGQEVTVGSLSSYYACIEFSVAAVMTDEAGPTPNVVNIAAASMGATCKTGDGKDCGLLIDGDTAMQSAWVFATSPVSGQSAKVTFREPYEVQFLSIMQRFGASGQTRTVTLEFSDHTTQEVVLKQRLGGSHRESRNAFWDDFRIIPVDTTFINFMIKDVYTEDKNGFIEIKVFSGCTSGYVRFQDHCYLLKRDRVKYFKANEVCVAAGAKLVRVDSAEENSFLTTLSGNNPVWIGFRDDYKGYPNAVWSWEGDSAAYSYTNWAPSKPSGTGRYGYCAVHRGGGLWTDVYCKYYNDNWFVCETGAPGTAAADD